MKRKPRIEVSKHYIELKEKQIEYVLRRSNQRRTIGLTVNHNGLTVASPWYVPFTEVLKFIEKSQDWIFGKLDKWQAPLHLIKSQWQDGKTLYYLDKPIQLKIETVILGQGAFLSENKLQVFTADLSSVPVLVQQWYREQAYPYFLQRLALISESLTRKPTKLSLSNAKNLWGCCNSKGEIRLNWRLIQASPEVIDYVIAHELAHLKHMNHSALFWSEVEVLCPDYKERRRELTEKDLLYRAM